MVLVMQATSSYRFSSSIENDRIRSEPDIIRAAYRRYSEKASLEHLSSGLVQGDDECPGIGSFGYSSTLFTVAEHGDFWTGNVLFRRTLPRNLSPFIGDFVVIDWRGSNIRGYPCSDLVRYCLSCYPPQSIHVGNALRNYNASLEIENFQVGIYLLASVGRLGLNLDQFPRDRYLVLCERIFNLMGAHGLTSNL